MTTDIAELLRSMPDLEPPVKGWQYIARQQVRRKLLRRGGGMAVAASVMIAVAVGALYFERPDIVASPAVQSTVQRMVQPIIVSAPAVQSTIRPDERAGDPEVRALQQRSQYMERLISGMPRRGWVARADTAGVIAELEDRIAAVDYQLNRAESFKTGFNRRESQAAGNHPRYERADAPDLWRRRVEYMDQLVRARYVEADVTGY